MKALVITPKNEHDFKFMSDLLKKLGVNASSIDYDYLEDIGLSRLMKDVDKTQKVSRDVILKKLMS